MKPYVFLRLREPLRLQMFIRYGKNNPLVAARGGNLHIHVKLWMKDKVIEKGESGSWLEAKSFVYLSSST